MSDFEAKNYVFVFSVNGKLVRKRKICFPIVVWCAWMSRNGFEFVAAADESEKIFVFEAFECNVGKAVHRCREQVIDLQYMEEIMCIVATTKDGRVLFMPHPEK